MVRWARAGHAYESVHVKTHDGRAHERAPRAVLTRRRGEGRTRRSSNRKDPLATARGLFSGVPFRSSTPQLRESRGPSAGGRGARRNERRGSARDPSRCRGWAKPTQRSRQERPRDFEEKETGDLLGISRNRTFDQSLPDRLPSPTPLPRSLPNRLSPPTPLPRPLPLSVAGARVRARQRGSLGPAGTRVRRACDRVSAIDAAREGTLGLFCFGRRGKRRVPAARDSASRRVARARARVYRCRAATRGTPRARSHRFT